MIHGYNITNMVHLNGTRPLMCSSARYNTHLYRLAVQAGFYSDAIECRIRHARDPGSILGRGKKVISIFSPVTLCNAFFYHLLMYVCYHECSAVDLSALLILTLVLTLRKLAHAIYRIFFQEVKIENFTGKFWIFLIFSPKTYIVGTKNHYQRQINFLF